MRIPRLVSCGGVLLLAACAGGGRTVGPGEFRADVSCAPFARTLTGVDLRGEAAAWWGEAEGRYARSENPAVGAILVLAVEPRLPHGHVAVVSRVLGAGEIEVVQANWVPGEVARDQPVIDASPDGTWSAVRVWYPPAGAMGAHAYPALGFILPDRPASRTELLHRATLAYSDP